MTKYHTHLCLVSKQAMPNLLPVLDPAWQPKRVVLAASPEMKAHAAALQGVITRKGLGIQTSILMLSDAYDYDKLVNSFIDFLGNNENESIALNVSGGTKLMAVAAQEVFRSSDKPVFYVNVDTDEVIVLGQQVRSLPLQARLRVKELLEAQAVAVEKAEQPEVSGSLRDTCARLIDHVGDAGRALGQINFLASQARNNPQLKIKLPEGPFDVRALTSIIGLFEEAGQLRLHQEWLQFPDEAARWFVNGGWLELYTYHSIQDLRGADGRITDVVMNMQVVHPDGRTRNEADVAFLYRNTLHLIECKTANLAPDGSGGDDKATEAIYKMEALLKLGGLRTRGMIVDYRGALSAHKPNLDRARNVGIEVISGSKLRDLKGCIKGAWLRG